MKDSDLKFFSDLLNERKEQIRKNIEDSTKQMQELSDNASGDELDHAAVSIDKTIDSAIHAQQAQELMEIEYVLNKIQNGTYGVCEMCEEDIGIERLKVKPHAKYCITCREIIEKNA